ncbi:hypothetical protein NL676_014972 [Syzygium grande]|nr:hypothetical protein NL676_014972 [Syzygium grande]
MEEEKNAFYVVRKGDVVGVYTSSSDCQAQVGSSLSCMIEFDGASKGNPGQAGAGAVLRAEDGSVVCWLCEGVGIATNNVAEYRAVILGLRYALQKGFNHVRVWGNLQLVRKQIQGLWKTKNQNMADLCKAAKELMDQFSSFEISHTIRAWLVLQLLGLILPPSIQIPLAMQACRSIKFDLALNNNFPPTYEILYCFVTSALIREVSSVIFRLGYANNVGWRCSLSQLLPDSIQMGTVLKFQGEEGSSGLFLFSSASPNANVR